MMLLLASAYNSGAVTNDDLNEDSTKELIQSLLEIPTTYKISGTGSSLDSRIASIAKQNQDAKVLPVSSYQWACLLKTLIKEDKSLTYSAAVARYNSHPDVVAYASSSNGSTDNSDTVFVDRKKEVAIKHWMENCGTEVYNIVEMSQHELTWQDGPFSESIANLDYIWIRSEAPFVDGAAAPDNSADFAPALGESFVQVDWKLPLTSNAQLMLFKRIYSDFCTNSAIVPASTKKKYRAKDVDLRPIRNVKMGFKSKPLPPAIPHNPWSKNKQNLKR